MTCPAPAAIERTRPVGFPLALGGWSSPVVGRGRWARIGDAAALADPLTGDGIGNALLSGRLLAEAVARSCSAGLGPTPAVAPGDAWQASFEASLQPELRRAWCMRQLLTGTRAKDTAAWMLDRFPGGLRERINPESVALCDLTTPEQEALLLPLLQAHAQATGSAQAAMILADWPTWKARFQVLVPPSEKASVGLVERSVVAV